MLENEEAKILLDFIIQYDHQIQSRRPDIVVVERKTRECKIIDIAVLNDVRVRNKEQEKVEEHQNLRREITTLWRMKKTAVIPIVLGTLGMISKKLDMWIKKIGINIKTEALQKSTLLGAA